MDIPILITYVTLMASALALGLATHQYRLNNASIRRLASRRLDTIDIIQKNRMDLLEARNRSRLLENTVKNGTTAVEMLHRTISATTFELIDRFSTSDDFRQSARRARENHDQTSRQIYRSVHTTNKALHRLADTLLSNQTKRRIRKTTRKPDGSR